MLVASLAIVLLVATLMSMLLKGKAAGILTDEEIGDTSARSMPYFVGWIFTMLVLIGLVGFPIGCALFIFLFTSTHVEGGRLRNAILAVSAVTFLGVMAHFLTLRYPEALLPTYLEP